MVKRSHLFFTGSSCYDADPSHRVYDETFNADIMKHRLLSRAGELEERRNFDCSFIPGFVFLLRYRTYGPDFSNTHIIFYCYQESIPVTVEESEKEGSRVVLE
jgi:hypothetical protein